MQRIVLIGATEELAHQMKSGNVTTISKKWSAVRRRPTALAEADVVIADLTTPGAYTARGIANLRRSYPSTPFVLRTDADLSHSEALQQLLDSSEIDFVRSSAKVDEVQQRVRRLLSRHPQKVESQKIWRGSLVPELHEQQSGRLNAKLIADFFGVSLSYVAQALGKSLSAVHKTPSSPRLQTGLFVFERIAVALLRLAGSKENARQWLNLPDPQFSDKAPLAVLREGNGSLVAERLDDILLGHPS
ncbi:MAG: DUF2384 domain-containing protein [Chthonomonadaceae bacterium]|nr:DUF2384 domain-containing protein [Chthonomonadaceae bacterium]